MHIPLAPADSRSTEDGERAWHAVKMTLPWNLLPCSYTSTEFPVFVVNKINIYLCDFKGFFFLIEGTVSISSFP